MNVLSEIIVLILCNLVEYCTNFVLHSETSVHHFCMHHFPQVFFISSGLYKLPYKWWIIILTALFLEVSFYIIQNSWSWPTYVWKDSFWEQIALVTRHFWNTQ